jgi:4-amino-4-deoxy-L-arabinose transferase-like glycosyltransferase
VVAFIALKQAIVFHFATQKATGANLRSVLLLTIPPAVLVGTGLGHFGLLNGNEVLYAEIAREMLDTGDFIVPHLNGVPYLEKPPLLYWAISLAMQLFGPTEVAARFPSALSALGLFGVVIWFGRRLGHLAVGLRAVYVLGTSIGFVLMARTAMPDGMFAALLLAALLAIHVSTQTGSASTRRMAFVALAMAFLTKGPLALVLFLLILLVFWLLASPEGRAPIRSSVTDPLAWLLFLLVTAQWFIAVSVRLPEFLPHYFYDEHILRFLGRREPHDYYEGTPLYYLPRIVLFFFPWLGLVILGAILKRRRVNSDTTGMARFLWICCLVPLAFFSASGAKANYYIIVCIPPLAILAAHYYEEGAILARRTWIALAFSLTIFAVIAALAIRAWLVRSGAVTRAIPAADGTGLLIVAVVLTLSILALLLIQLRQLRTAAYLLGLFCVPVLMGILHIAAHNEPYISTKQVAQIIRERFASYPVYLYGDFEALGGVPFYLGKTVPVIDSSSSDLRFGKMLDPTSDRFAAAEAVPKAGAPALVVVRGYRDSAFRQAMAGKKVDRVAQSGSYSVYSVSR